MSQVAQTILAQLGGSRFIAMTGAKAFLGGDDRLTFTIGRNASRANRVRVTLAPTDTYRVEFLRVANLAVSTIKAFDGLMFDQLQSTFTDVTGLHTRL